jgi:hypothetical protein
MNKFFYPFKQKKISRQQLLVIVQHGPFSTHSTPKKPVILLSHKKVFDIKVVLNSSLYQDMSS